MSLINVENAFVRSKSVRVRNKLPKDQMQIQTHPVRTDKKLTPQQAWAETAQARITELKGTNPKIIINQQTTVINQERRHKMAKRIYPRTLQTEKSPTPLVTYITRTQTWNI